jgi:hypothetical protein
MSIVSDVLAALDRLQWFKELRALPARVAQLEQRLAALEGGRPRSGPPCPLCETGTLKTIKVEPDPLAGELGVQRHTLQCTGCDHSEQRTVVPK